jgi:hypothetical protein
VPKRGVGARFGGIETFLNLKKSYDDAKRQRQWQAERDLFKERGEEKRSIRRETGANVRSLIREGYQIPRQDLANLMAGGGVDTTQWGAPRPKGTKPSVGERAKIQAFLDILSSRRDPESGRLIRSREEAESMVRRSGIDPKMDWRIEHMINQYPSGEGVRGALRGANIGARERIAGMSGFVPMAWPLKAAERLTREADITIPDLEDIIERFEKGDRAATEELQRLIEEGVVEYDPETNEIRY